MSEIKFINQFEKDKKFTYDERIALLRKIKVAQTEEKARNGGANEDDYGLIVQNEFNYKLKPNHENGSIYGYKMANYMSMEDWINVYDGDLGTVLTDTYTTDVFLRNFSKKHASLFTSLRHDSGDPLVFVDKVIKRYEELRVDSKLKYLVFSDSLNVDKVLQIKDYCGDRIGATFGIGTNLTNDVGYNIRSMNIVMKLFRCKMTAKEEWQECVKLSDVEGKHTGSEREIALVKETLGLS